MLRNIIVDIDMILDTRAGTLRRIIPKEEVDQLINSEAYRMRTHDDMWKLCNITKQQWEDGWALRDEITLSYSMPTMAMVDLVRMIGDIDSVVQGNNPGLTDVRFLVNTYPYKITPVNALRIAAALKYNMSTTCEVIHVALDNSRLSPQQCKERNIIMAIMYDYMKYNQDCFPDDAGWSEDNLPVPNPDLTIIAPMIDRDYFNKKEEMEKLGVALPDGVTPFTMTAEVYQLIHGLEFVNTSYACEVTEEVRRRIQEGRESSIPEKTEPVKEESFVEEEDDFFIPQPINRKRS